MAEKTRSVVKCQSDNVDWFICLLEVSLCCLTSGRGTGANEHDVNRKIINITLFDGEK